VVLAGWKEPIAKIRFFAFTIQKIQIDKVIASFKDGVLEIRMPKSEAAKQKIRKIAVK